MEVANPSQGRLRGRTDEPLILTGKDKAYLKAASLGRLFVPFDKTGKPLEMRVARHMTAMMNFFSMMEIFLGDDKAFLVEGLPTYTELTKRGIGNWLNPLP
jgi:hypothetical protein